MLNGHGGNIYQTARRFGYPQDDIIDMSSNINPLGPPPGLLEFLKGNLARVTRLPEVDSRMTLKAFATFLEIDSDYMLAGNGTTQFIYLLPSVLGIRKALIIGPTYGDYGDACKINRVPASIFVVAGSYLPFVQGGELESMMRANLKNVIVLLSISKIFAIPGLRIGFVMANKATIKEISRFLLPWSVNCLAHTAVQYLAERKDEIQAFVQKTRNFIQEQREEIGRSLRDILAIKLHPSVTPFFLVRLPQAVPAESAWISLARERILIRNCSNFPGLSDRFIRIALKAREANQLLVEKMRALVTASNKLYQSLPRKQNVGV